MCCSIIKFVLEEKRSCCGFYTSFLNTSLCFSCVNCRIRRVKSKKTVNTTWIKFYCLNFSASRLYYVAFVKGTLFNKFATTHLLNYIFFLMRGICSWNGFYLVLLPLNVGKHENSHNYSNYSILFFVFVFLICNNFWNILRGFWP